MTATLGVPERGRKLCFEILSQIDHATGPAARLGRLSIQGRRDLETPNFIAITSRGVVPHLSPDVVAAQTSIGGVHMALEDYVEKTTRNVPSSVLNCPTGPGSRPPLHAFTGLPDSTITLLSPRRMPAVTAPTGSSNTAISIFTSTGFQILSNAAYIAASRTLQPDITIALGDISYNQKPGSKRVEKMGDRTQEWVSQALDADTEDQPQRQNIFAPVLPIDVGHQFSYLDYLADDVADHLAGLAFFDADTLPDIPATTTFLALPRLSLADPTSPREVLRQIALGMDILTIPFVGTATDAGIALSFEFPEPSSNTNEDEETSAGSAARPLGLDMWSPRYATSLAPLSPSCACYACTAHHRAYLVHLLAAKEMLGWTLLQIHNHAVVAAFLAAVRLSISRGTWDADRRRFETRYESDIPVGSGAGPRLRGYQYKSEANATGQHSVKGEKKRNRKAWANLDPAAPGDAKQKEKERPGDVVLTGDSGGVILDGVAH